MRKFKDDTYMKRRPAAVKALASVLSAYLLASTVIFSCSTAVIADEEEPAPSDISIEETVQDNAGNEQPEIIVLPELEQYSNSFFNATTESGISVDIEASYDAFPEGTSLSVSDVDASIVIDNVNDQIPDDINVDDAVAVDISFYDSEGNEIQPCEGSYVGVRISLPVDMELEGDDLKLIHMDDEGIATEIEDADITSSDAQFTAEGFSIYVLTSVGERDKDKVHAYIEGAGVNERFDNNGFIDNSDEQRYKVMKGETFTLIGKSADTANLTFSVSNSNISIVTPEAERVASYNSKTGQYELWCEFSVDNTKPWHENCEITLTAVNGSDTVTETFYLYCVENSAQDRVFNIDTDSLEFGSYIFVKPYETLTLIGTPNSSDNVFYFVDSDGHVTGESVLYSFDRSQGSYDPSTNTRTDHINVNGYSWSDREQKVRIETPSGIREITLVCLNSDQQLLDHADIEIADGGYYTTTRFENRNGQLIKKVYAYETYVCGVEWCHLYKADGTPVDFFKLGANDTIAEYTPEVTGFVRDDYGYDPKYQPGDSQYEYTSKYHIDANGNRVDWSQKKFLYYDVDHALFNVDLDLRPLYGYEMVLENGTWVKVQDSDVSYTKVENGTDPETGEKVYIWYETKNGVTTQVALDDVREYIKPVVFYLGKSYVADAFNKCPNHSGLDFTIKQNSAIIEFEATKEMVGTELDGRVFEFEMVDKNGQVIQTATNDENGKVKFDVLHYEAETGASPKQFTIREKIDLETYPDIDFDRKEYRVEITVTRDEQDGYLYADVREEHDEYDFVFNNKPKARLPETGGMGTLIFYLLGLMFITGAGGIYIKGRREEEGS